MGKMKDIVTDRLEMERLRDECPECGGQGHTVVVDDELGQMMTACETCRRRELEDDPAFEDFLHRRGPS